MSENSRNRGIARHRTDTPSKDTPPHPPSLTMSSTATAKQQEALILLSKGLNPYQIARKLGNLDVKAIKDRLKYCEHKGLMSHTRGNYRLTEAGKVAVNAGGVGGGVSGSVFINKSQHANEISCKLLKLPGQFNEGYFFMQSMGAKEVYHAVSAKTWFAYFPECTLRIAYNKGEITFFIKEQVAISYEATEAKVWEQFVKHFRIVKENGFELDYNIFSRNAHFADPNGFFAKLSAYSDGKGFKIETDIGNFWVDFSNGYAEEETDKRKIADRTEDLARSAIKSKSNFQDMDKACELVPQLVQLSANILQIQSNTVIPAQQPSSPQAPPLQEKKEKEERDYFG